MKLTAHRTMKPLWGNSRRFGQTWHVVYSKGSTDLPIIAEWLPKVLLLFRLRQILIWLPRAYKRGVWSICLTVGDESHRKNLYTSFGEEVRSFFAVSREIKQVRNPRKLWSSLSLVHLRSLEWQAVRRAVEGGGASQKGRRGFGSRESQRFCIWLRFKRVWRIQFYTFFPTLYCGK